MTQYHSKKAHIFVCTHERAPNDPRGCCKAKDSEKVLAVFKEELVKKGLHNQVRAQKSGCLDVCEKGVSVVVYPDGVWYGRVKTTDVPEIVQSHIMDGKPVERLRF